MVPHLPNRVQAAILAILAAAILAAGPKVCAQSTVATGSVQGTILDTSGAVVPTAKVSVGNEATGLKLSPPVTSSGVYNSGALSPGEYTIEVQAAGFSPVILRVTVKVGQVVSGDVTLRVGSTDSVVNVTASSERVNTDQPTIQGVLTSRQIEDLPISGRNFLDASQLEPGVQIQNGSNFNSTKNGYSSISIGGRFGRSARIEVDGQDISDEEYGTTTLNIPELGIHEFQISQSSLDLSTELTSSGAVSVVTKSGTNKYHGEGFFQGRSDALAARLGPTEVPYSRKQAGVSLGGPLVKDKLFFFGTWERLQQDLFAPVVLGAPFQALSGSFNAPLRDSEFLGRVDWNIKPGWTAFYRFSYEQNRIVSTRVPNTYEPYLNEDHTPAHAAGLDFVNGRFSHSFRFGYLKLRNADADAVAGTSIFDPAPQVTLNIGSQNGCTSPGADVFCSGPSSLAPQANIQRNLQFKYDGTWVYKSHVLRYGAVVNSIKVENFGAFFGLAPVLRANFTAADRAIADKGPFPGGSSNPLNYPVDALFLSNGQGYTSEKPAFGYSGGGFFDTRTEWYVGDAWKIRHNLSLSGGLRYLRDTGRSNSDLPDVPALDQFMPGLGRPVRQPNHDFGGLLGLVWDPTGGGKTVIRSGVGLYYDDSVVNNQLGDRISRLSTGLLLNRRTFCPNGVVPLATGQTVTSIDGLNIATQICGQPIGSVASAAADLQKLFQQAAVQAGALSNPQYFGTILAAGPSPTGTQVFDPNYRSPYSFQFNGGVQRQLWPGAVLSVDYLRNVNLHTLLRLDVNHVGDAAYLDKAGALAAISKTDAAFGCAGTSGTAIDCAIAKGATIANYASNGLSSGGLLKGGLPSGVGNVAFPGINPNFGQIFVAGPYGRSVYNALQVKLVGAPSEAQLTSTFLRMKIISYQIAYTLSRFDGDALDVDFDTTALDFRNSLRYFGPNGLDRTHQLSAGATFQFPLKSRVSFITHWFSPLPQTLALPATNKPQDIFQTDLTGDGTTGDLLPGTNVGSFGRGVSAGGLNNLITSYNNTYPGKLLTPAGQALVNASLFTSAELVALGATPPPLSLAPPGQVGLSPLFTFDLRLAGDIRPGAKFRKVPESITIQPYAQIFNLFNRANFDAPNAVLSGVLNGLVGSVNGTTAATRANRTGLGTGGFDVGAPRQIELGFRVVF